MTIDDFAYEYDRLVESRQKEGLKKIFDYILSDIDRNNTIIGDMLDLFVGLEAEDAFGTEGLDI
jgi:hypothetical protein